MRSSARAPTEPRLPPLLVICGPTATGKTALSLDVGAAFPGSEIISADSRQVYRGMDIGTAKVSAEDRARVPHHGLDLVAPDEAFSAADFRRHALGALRAIAARGGLAILVGGTGLYLRAVARDIPLEETGADPEVRAGLERRLAGEGLHALVADLRSRAPATAARTDLANPRRVVRALERVAVSGDNPPPAPRGYPGPIAWLGLDTDPETNDRWIEERARWQFANGLLDEAAGLRERYGAALPAFSAFGYREAFALLRGEASRAGAIEQTIARTRRFARRQRTWFRAEPGIRWLDAARDQVEAATATAARLLTDSATGAP
ncbi:MAG: tRNA (adenosine(37)-N6)-dimethylallyltransferase MiaA [Chloroflexota bacterium]|nr:tRNA (adenosine(37)-N6)-dimethylallyltransferase MiaA [Chloroflexota bacterium]